MNVSMKSINTEELNNLSISEWKELWQKEFKDKSIPSRKQKLIKELSYKLQTQQYGDLDKNTKVTLSRRMKTYEDKLKGKNKKDIQTKPKFNLEPGTVIKRDWKGKTIEVQVLEENKFQYEKQIFTSLSKLANHITGQHLSGPRFFKLDEKS